ncbi:MAG: hypothetical protein ABI273_10430 [Lacunisphaera sp.]
MPRKSNCRTFADREFAGTVLIMNGPCHLRYGLLTALALVVTSANAQTPTRISTHEPVHSISPEIMEAVVAKLPKYDPTAAEKSDSNKTAANEAYESGGVLYLPKVTVSKGRVSTPSDFAFLTPKGRMELAFKTFPGLRIGNVLGANKGKEGLPFRADNGDATTMQAESREVARKESMKETVERTRTDDGPESRRLDKLLKAALARPSMFWAGDDRP